MCGRYAITTVPEAMRGLFRYRQLPNFPARFNVAPTQPIPIVRLMNGEREFALVRWGLLPSWVKDPKTIGLLFNARGESVMDKPSFRNAMRRRRCLIPADGFYEWQPMSQQKGARKQPYFIRQKSGAPFAFAGLWETWTGPNGEELETAAIVTTTANNTLRPIHDRMPVILASEQYDLWLDNTTEDVDAAAALIKPAPDDWLEAFPVSTDVNRVANDNPKLIERTAVLVDAAPPPKTSAKPAAKPIKKEPKEKKDSGQGALF